MLVAQFIHGGSEDDLYGGPMMISVASTNQYLNKFEFPTIHNTHNDNHFHHSINIVVMAQYYQPSMICLIAGGVNKSLATQEWVPVQINSTTIAYATQVNIPEGVTELFHSDSVAKLMVIVYGFSS